MLRPTERPAGLCGPPVGRLHQPGPATGDHRQARLGEASGRLPAELVPAVPLGHPGRAEDRDAVVDLPQRVEPHLDLGVDPVEPAVVFGFDVDW